MRTHAHTRTHTAVHWRGCEGVSGSGCVCACLGVPRCVWAWGGLAVSRCARVSRRASVCLGVSGGAWVCLGVPGCVS
eukprot:11355759-Alexandrium_andersonii.AAC.1